jgi:hypothetical protein
VEWGNKGEVPEWPKGADCKSAGDAFEGSNPSLSTIFLAGIAQLVEREPSKLGVAGSSPVSRSNFACGDGKAQMAVWRAVPEITRAIAFDRNAQVAQSVEHVLGKDEVGGSIPLLGFAQMIMQNPRNIPPSTGRPTGGSDEQTEV